MRLMLRFLGLLFAAGTILFVVGVAAAAGLLWHYSQSLPDYSQLQDYEPAVMTRVHASDGSLLAEYARERRLYIPIQAVPKLVTSAFIAAEDKNFYEHGGIDFSGIARAAVLFVQQYGSGRRPQGASTITQQVAKNFLLTNEVSFSRKIKEALLAMKIERDLSPRTRSSSFISTRSISAWAPTASPPRRCSISTSRCTNCPPAEAAYLAALPKAPNNYHPFRQRDRAIERRNYVLDRMAEDRYITAQDAEKSKKEPLKVTPRPTGAHIFAAEYFAEEVRRYVYENYSEKKLYEGGLSVRTTLDPKMQVLARKVLVDGFVNFDEQQGYRGPVEQARHDGRVGRQARRHQGAFRHRAVAARGGAGGRTTAPPASACSPDATPAARSPRSVKTGVLPLEGMKWAKPTSGPTKGKTPTKVSQVLNVGDVIYVEPLAGKEGQFRLRQVPEVSGAIVAMDPQTGRVLAMVGGFSYDQSQFNRATQALRQPGSSFKPLVYAAALDNGYTPSTVVMDAPIEIDRAGTGIWAPENYSTANSTGLRRCAFGIEQSRNVMTVRLAQDVGMPLIAEYAKRFGVYDDLPPYLSFALGAGETTVHAHGRRPIRCSPTAAGSIKPTLIDRIQDRYGRTIYKHDSRECRGCDADKWANQPEPTLVDKREQVLDPMTAYQITSMMEGVVQRGTATVVKEVGKPIAGKTGTTNDEKDAWFIGFSPDLVVGVYLGYDKPRHLGRGATGGVLAAPIVRGFHEGRARRQARGSVPGAGRHQAHPHRRQERHARGAGRLGV